MDEIVYKAELKGIICQFIKQEDGYIRQQIFPNGTVYEGDYSEEEYQSFLQEVKIFDEALKSQTKTKKTKKAS